MFSQNKRGGNCTGVLIVDHRSTVSYSTPRDISGEKGPFVCCSGDIAKGLKPSDRVNSHERSLVTHCSSL